MSMDGNNRTVIINVERRRYYNDAMLSFTLDYQAQVLYWIFSVYTRANHSLELNIESSNVDGTNRQTIIQLSDNHSETLRFPPHLTIYKGMLFLSSIWNDKIYKLRTNGKNFTTFVNSSVLCGVNYHQLKVMKQPPGELQYD